jgi:hypothetical protein
MAELPRYQQTGLTPGDIPRLDLANIKESVNLTKTISNSLDRISDFAFKEAAEKAQNEGLQYGAENMPSTEQVMLAIEQGKSPSELFAKPGTIFGDAARQYQASQLRVELETRIRENFTKLSAAVDVGKVDMKDLTLEIKGSIDGYSRILSSLDPKQALQFRASAASAGNAVYTKATQKSAKMFALQTKQLAKDSLATTKQTITDIIASEQDPTMIVNRIRIERQRVLDVIAMTNDDVFGEAMMKDFDAKQAQSIVEYMISPEVSKNTTDGIARIQRGDVGKLSELFKNVDSNEVLAGYFKRVSETRSALQVTKDVEKLSNEEAANGLLIEYYNSNTNQARKSQIGVQLAKMKVLSIDQMDRFLNADAKDGDPYVAANIKYRVVTGEISDLDELRKATTSAGLSGKQYAPLAQALIDRTKTDESRAIKKISNTAGFGDVRQGRNKNNEHMFNKEQKILGYYEEAKMASIRDRGSFNPDEISKIAIDRYNNTDRAEIQVKNAEQKLASLAKEIKEKKKIKTEFVIDESTNVDDLLSKKLITPDEATAIRKHQKVLNGANQ